MDADRPVARVASISGGKDSTALYLLAQERLGDDFRAVFADTGNEHPWTYEAVERISGFNGGPKVQTVRADLSGKFEKHRRRMVRDWPRKGVPDHILQRALEVMHPTGNPFLDMCMLAHRFPSQLDRFCTRRLKIEPIRDNVYTPLWDAGYAIENWQGIRADESRARAKLPERAPWAGRQTMDGPCEIYRPLLQWTIEDVWAMHDKHGFKRSPLYDVGMKRVGCAPCIMEGKKSIMLLSRFAPEEVDRIREWERIVGLASKREDAKAGFLPIPVAYKKRNGQFGDGIGIDQVIEWSKTARGGRQHDMFENSEIFGPCEQMGVCGD